MYLLHLDESGNPNRPDERHYVLAGVAVFERAGFHLTRMLDGLHQRYAPRHPDARLHPGAIRTGKGPWRRVPRPERLRLLEEMGGVVTEFYAPAVVLFGAVVDRSWGRGGKVVHVAMEQCCRRFDLHLSRKVSAGHDQRGALVLPATLRARLAAADGPLGGVRLRGTAWGGLRYVSDAPLEAVPAGARCLQMAAYVAHALYAAYERDDGALLAPLLPRFDHKDGVMHGLVHLTPRWRTCACQACGSRRTVTTRGDDAASAPWPAELEDAEALRLTG